MLCENDLVCKISEYRYKETITESDCVKLAAFLTIRDCLYPQEYDDQQYSFADAPEETQVEKATVDYDSDKEFFAIANGMDTNKVWKVVDELMETLQVINPRLYAGVIRKLQE